MKKVIALVVILVMVLSIGYACAEDVKVKIPKEVMEKAIADKDPTPIIKDYLLPFLLSNNPNNLFDNQALMIFAAELNISNGSPHYRTLDPVDVNGDGTIEPGEQGWGERALWGKQADSGTALKYHEDYAEMTDDFYKEIRRLLLGTSYENGNEVFGVWNRGGNTTFKFATKSNSKELSYETGKWSKPRTVLVIQILHTTEYRNVQRVSAVACDWKNLTEDGFYEATFKIVRR